MSIGIGVFGKIPSYPEFVRIGSAGPTDKAFERWLQMANDQLARADVKLSSTPIGFAFRDEKAESLLIGVVVGSRDKVGRRFPLAVYCEYGVVKSTVLSLLAEAFRPALTQLSMLAMTALETDREALKNASKRVEVPRGKTIRDGREATSEALRTIPVEQVLARMFVDQNDRAYGINVIQRACAQSVRDGAARPTCIDATVTSDMELCFAFAAAESQLPETMGPLSAFWDVSSQRVVVVPGLPDSKLLVAMAAPHSQNQKIWRTETSSETSRKGAWEKISDPVKELLKEPGEASIQELLDRMMKVEVSPETSTVGGKSKSPPRLRLSVAVVLPPQRRKPGGGRWLRWTARTGADRARDPLHGSRRRTGSVLEWEAAVVP